MFAKPSTAPRSTVRPGPSGGAHGGALAKVLANPTLSVSAAGLFFVVTAAAALLMAHFGLFLLWQPFFSPGASVSAATMLAVTAAL